MFIDGGQFVQIGKETRRIMVPFLYLAIKSLYWSNVKTLKKIMWCDDENVNPYSIKTGKCLTFKNMHNQMMDEDFPKISKELQEHSFF